MGCSISSAKRKVYSNECLHKIKNTDLQINYSALHLKELELASKVWLTTLNRSGPGMWGKLSHQMSPASVLRKSLSSGHQMTCKSSQPLLFSLDCNVDPSVYPLEFGGTRGA